MYKMLRVLLTLKPLVDEGLMRELLDVENTSRDRTSNLPGLGCDVFHGNQPIACVAGSTWLEDNRLRLTLDPASDKEMKLLRELIEQNGCSLPGEGQRLTRNNSHRHSEVERDVALVTKVEFEEHNELHDL